MLNSSRNLSRYSCSTSVITPSCNARNTSDLNSERFRESCAEKAFPTIPVSSETVQTPSNAVIAPMILPIGVIGETSPYPTVVKVISDHQIASGIDLKSSGCLEFSAKKIKDEVINNVTVKI